MAGLPQLPLNVSYFYESADCKPPRPHSTAQTQLPAQRARVPVRAKVRVPRLHSTPIRSVSVPLMEEQGRRDSVDEVSLMEILDTSTFFDVWPANNLKRVTELNRGRGKEGFNAAAGTKKLLEEREGKIHSNAPSSTSAAKPKLLLEIETFIQETLARRVAQRRKAENEGRNSPRSSGEDSWKFSSELEMQLERASVYKASLNLFCNSFRTYSDYIRDVTEEFDKCFVMMENEMKDMDMKIRGLEEEIGKAKEDHTKSKSKHHASMNNLKKMLNDQKQISTTTQGLLEKAQAELNQIHESIGLSAEEEKESKKNNSVLLKVIRKLEIELELKTQEFVKSQECEAELREQLSNEKEKVEDIKKLLGVLHKEKADTQTFIEELHVKMAEMKKQYEEDLSSTNRIKAELSTTKLKLQTVTTQFREMSDKLRKANQELEEFSKLALTPRPDWGTENKGSTKIIVAQLKQGYTVARYIARRAVKELHHLRHLAQLLCLREELKEEPLDQQPKLFNSFGVGAGVMAHLRATANQKIKNRRLAVSETMEVMISFWKERDSQKTRDLPKFFSTTASDVFTEFLKLRFTGKGVNTEYAYSLHYMMKQSPFPFLKHSFLILNGALPEATRSDFSSLVLAVKEGFYLCTLGADGKANYELTRNDYIKVLNDILPWKDSARFVKLVRAMQPHSLKGASIKALGDVISFETMFDYTPQFRETEFVTELHTQYLDERDEWFRELEGIVLRSATEAKAAQDSDDESVASDLEIQATGPLTDEEMEGVPTTEEGDDGKKLKLQILKDERKDKRKQLIKAALTAKDCTVNPLSLYKFLIEMDKNLKIGDLIALLLRAFQCPADKLYEQRRDSLVSIPESEKSEGESDVLIKLKENKSADMSGRYVSEVDSKDKGENPRYIPENDDYRTNFTEAMSTPLETVIARLKRGIVRYHTKREESLPRSFLSVKGSSNYN